MKTYTYRVGQGEAYGYDFVIFEEVCEYGRTHCHTWQVKVGQDVIAHGDTFKGYDAAVRQARKAAKQEAEG